MKLKSSVLAILTFILFTLSPAYAAIHTIDVMVVYPHHVIATVPGKDMPAKLALLIANANQSYKVSNVNIRLRVVYLKEVAIPGTGNVSRRALFSLARDQNIQKLREQYGADLVVLLTLRRSVGGGFFHCGNGFIANGSDGKFDFADTSEYKGARNAGFSVTAINCDVATFAHEIGHNMGLGHSFPQDSEGGIYKWGRGHGVFGDFTTIMAYPSAYGSVKRLQRFSSPTQIKCNGQPCGVPHNQIDAADAVTSLNAVAKQASDFFPTKVPRSVARRAQ
jgi:hypothetical protein